MALVKIKDFNALSDNKRFFDIPIKKEKCQEIIIREEKIY